jgi:hypothetical protein
MSLDYRKFKTPYFEISVGDSKGTRMVNLPHHIIRLIKRVEIIETWEENAFNTIHITFVEGSREPASADASRGTDGLYKIASYDTGKTDMNLSGSLTNRTGIITDLRFSGSSGITFITGDEKRNKAIDTSLQKNVINEQTTRSYQREESRPRFLFQERNQVKVTWGYKEDPQSRRSIRTYIMVVSVRYPESGQVETTITCQDTGAALDQITTSKGVPFGTRITTPKGSSITEFKDSTTEELIRNIATRLKIPAVVSKNLPVPTLDENHQKVWLAEESFQQFMTRLAKYNNCYFKVVPDKESGIDTLYFVKKSDFEKRILVNRQLLTYKAPNSIIKNASIRVDFGVDQGTTVNGINSNGKNEASKVEDILEVVHLTDGKEPGFTDRDPTSPTNAISAAQGAAELTGGAATGKFVITPDSNPKNKESFAEWIEEGAARVIQLDLTTIGFTRLTPGTIDVAGLGVRYSGKYRVMTATHIISADSYETRCQATSMTVGAGGLVSPAALVEQDSTNDNETVTVRAFTRPDEDQGQTSEIQKQLRKLRE